MGWKNIFYAPSATVGAADDFDGHGKQEVALGNEYYNFANAELRFHAKGYCRLDPCRSEMGDGPDCSQEV
jgi:hypothetical protein